ncbi:tRNA 5-methylaminomethyl-2-thiouridine biosynthesis bifunctional protein MnmC [Clarias magur]|uniref:tRNA 5-methylaminomethyl-2-thiouridine biosynthesis bifunctional protein MnmC n=1 Tax=Clarias magur TaxID=1594786 RepID=A0A8J4XAL3_CLAMG|nr:tRNA 5-methylaminomethyl-2-thiouridine biosynthesis bifunctional protein MnmC [Clarias magur]
MRADARLFPGLITSSACRITGWCSAPLHSPARCSDLGNPIPNTQRVLVTPRESARERKWRERV